MEDILKGDGTLYGITVLRSEDPKAMTPDKVKPVREIVFIRRETEDDRFGNSPIVRPETYRAEMGIAEVIAVGEDVQDKYAPGDKVYLGKLAGLKITEMEGSYFLVNHQEILAKIVG